ncbi:hypothetical protein PV328_005955 [Microctonus aethiopoides]|uniref:MYND-type domain-containing protein n=1 Tax=Microctonus aethiopoides TaxID=144406 RepID=A0AA39KT50_9HYME|nr:hypothetical protein PV328_005955 [Microctonus aethiopoides]
MTSKDDHFASSDSLRDDHCPMNNKIWTTVDVDLVNGSNTWLPAYGFQHHHNYFEPTHEESRINETNVIASTDFLETILEETSDDLQSDSDRSDDSTTYWLGSDSETESVIHITNNQQMAGERLSESDSKSNNSVIPKKRRRRTSDKRDCYCNYSSSTTMLSDNNRWVASSRSSSRSSTSSRSSSLVQFENLERTCATVSPSGYSYDSLEYSNNSNSCFDNTSPDSLEDMENVTVNQTKSFGVNNKKSGLISKIRPYRSFESLNTCHHENKMFRGLNDDDDEDEDDDIDDEPFERNLRREIYDYENDYDENNSEGDDINNYHSVDWKNTIDLREIGLETNREAVLLDLARSQIKSSLDPLYSRLNIDTANNMAMGVASGEEQRWSNETSANFNFRFTNKSQSVPSIPSCLDALLSDCVFDSRQNNTDNYNTSRHSLNAASSIRNFENFARVASVPGDLNYFGVISPSDEALVSHSNGINTKYHHEMADNMSEMADYSLQNEESSNNIEANETIKKSTVKTQDHGFDVMLMENNIDAVVDEAIRQFKSQVEEATNFGIDNDEFFTNEGYRVLSSAQQRPRRVKNNASYELAQQWEINEKDVGLSLPSNSCSTSGLKKRVMNNASYELAQQSDYVKALQLTSKTFQRMDACDELHEPQNDEKNVTFNQYNEKSDLSKIKYESMNDNYKNISHNDNKQQQHDNLLDQIKKNSVPFSIYGEIGSCKNNSIGINSMTDDEIDLAYLETKYISSNKPDDNLIFNVNANASNNDDKCSNSELMCGEISTINRHNYLNECINSDEMALVVDTSDLDADEQRLGNVAVAGNHQTVNVFADEGNETQPMTVNSSSKIEEAETDSHWHRQYTSDSVNNASPLSSRVGKVIVARVLDNKTDYRSEDDCGNEEQEEEEEEEEKNTRKKERNKLSTEENDDKQLDASSSKEAEKEEEVKKQKNKEDMVLMEKDEKQERIQAIREVNDDNRKSLSSVPIPSSSSSRSNNDMRIKNNLMMRFPISDVPDETKKKSGLGGFFQRFSRLRFSGRSSKTPRMDAKKIRGGNIETVEAKLLGDKRNLNSQPTIESNYTIIPLHPPDGKTKREENIHHHHQQQHESLFRNCAISNVENTTTTHDQRTYVGENGRSSAYSSKPPLPPLHHHSMRACSSSSRNMSFSDGGGSVGTRRRAITDLGSPVNIEMAKARAMQQQHHHHDTIVQQNERPIGLLETDLDADIPNICDESGSSINDGNTTSGKKTRSLLNLNHSSHQGRENVLLRVPQSPGQIVNRNTSDKTDHAVVVGPINHRPHKSMEFLLDKENLHFIKPPENELQKVMGAVPERVPSEHELRVQRSLQRLNVPDWYKNSPAARDGFRLKRHSDASQHGGWRSLGSKTTSLSSLSSSSNLRQPNSTMDYTGPLSSPTPPPVFSRWSTSLLNSAGNMPITNNTSSPFTHRQPYLGWRSQERLANPRTPAERLAQGILPQIESKKQQQQINQQLDVRNSIKEVTSAIVHYVQSGQETLVTNNSTNLSGSREAAKLCWMESSFVGSRPVDSPETPMSLATDTECCCTDCNATSTKSCTCAEQSMASGLYLDLAPSDTSCCPSPSTLDSRQHHQHRHAHHQQQQQQQQPQRYYRETSEREQTSAENKEAMSTTTVTTTSTTFVRNKPSPGSTTLEDVLDSLLGLPSVSSRTPSPSSKCVKRGKGIMMDVGLRRLLGAVTNPAELKIRRKSEGSDIIVSSTHGGLPLICNRHVKFDGTDGQTVEKLMVKCRNNKCNNTANIADAKRLFKRCPNCTCLYCSRECRKAHWQRHRMTCLHSRVGALFRQVLSSAQHDVSTLRHISILATQGYVAHGRGAVYCFFSSPKAAEKFISNGFKDLGEPIYVRSSDLLPSEMGTELYGEIMELCKSYDPNTRLVLYVAVCVVSKVPRTVCSDDSGVIKYERQLISRCGKIKLDEKIQKQISPCKDNNTVDVPETLVLTSMPQSNNNDSNEENTMKKVREISFNNIKRQLRLRGISLRKHFPQVYKKLCSYVDGSVDQFAPVTIYPRDKVSGKSFMCIIMLDAAPESLQLLPADLSRVKTVDIIRVRRVAQ